MSSVYVWTTDGDVRQLSPDGANAWVSCIAPDGSYALFAIVEDGASRIWRAGIPSGECTVVSPDGMHASLPAFGPDGDTVVFTGGTNIFAMSPDGSDVRRITGGPFNDVRPCLSPDGGTIAFFANRRPQGAVGLYLVDAAGGEPSEFLDFPVGRPWYSTDGSTIYCFKVERDACRLIAVSASDASWSYVPNDEGHTHGAYADLRGDRLIVHSAREGDAPMRLWELPLDGSPATKLVPPGFEDEGYAHGTRAHDGTMTFDSRRGGPQMDYAAAFATPTMCWRTLHPAPAG